MTKTYAQLKKQIDTLSREAEGLKQKERAGVIGRIKEAIEIYELTAAELGLDGAGRKAGAGRKPGKAAGKPGRKAAVKKTAKAKDPAAVKFRDADGNGWGGRGPRPQWLRTALSAGKELKDFAV
ncbi:MAG TPA: H-NS histone family protein [Ideonella sp.]|nr:H-NS histone family protein [Ideonella sp.]